MNIFYKMKEYFAEKFRQTNKKVPKSIVGDLTCGIPTKIDELIAEVEVDQIEGIRKKETGKKVDYSDRFLN